MSQHRHNWHTRYIVIDCIDTISGMECECGEILEQDEVESIVWLWQCSVPENSKPLAQLIDEAVSDALKYVKEFRDSK